MDELPISSGDDVVRVRQQVRVAAAAGGLSLIDQTKLVTAASELARNALIHGYNRIKDLTVWQTARDSDSINRVGARAIRRRAHAAQLSFRLSSRKPIQPLPPSPESNED